jgi:hypothetical protein
MKLTDLQSTYLILQIVKNPSKLQKKVLIRLLVDKMNQV